MLDMLRMVECNADYHRTGLLLVMGPINLHTDNFQIKASASDLDLEHNVPHTKFEKKTPRLLR